MPPTCFGCSFDSKTFVIYPLQCPSQRMAIRAPKRVADVLCLQHKVLLNDTSFGVVILSSQLNAWSWFI